MPQASQETLDQMCKVFDLDTIDQTHEVMEAKAHEYLASIGLKDTAGMFTWPIGLKDAKATAAINYLCEEWDYACQDEDETGVKSSSWFAWVKGNDHPIPQLWHNGDRHLNGKPLDHLWKYNLAVGEDIDFTKLVERFPLHKCVAGTLPPQPVQYAKVSLLNYTGYGSSDERWFAARLMAYTKATRLEQGEETIHKFTDMPIDELEKELNYMAKTIRSSWEFVDYTFQINNVTRAFTHQLVRTRTGSYAQQAQRVVDMKNFGNSVPDTVQMDKTAKVAWEDTMNHIASGYEWLQKLGIPNQDCRGVLPTNVHTNIIAKFNLRTLTDLVAKRKNLRAQGEYGFVAAEMERCVLKVHPWAKVFLSPERLATPALDGILKQMLGTGSPVDQPVVNAALKEIDALKGTWG